jgi:hypothetical protein
MVWGAPYGSYARPAGAGAGASELRKERGGRESDLQSERWAEREREDVKKNDGEKE